MFDLLADDCRQMRHPLMGVLQFGNDIEQKLSKKATVLLPMQPQLGLLIEVSEHRGL